LKYNEQTGKLSIGDTSGSFDGMLKSRKFNIVWISKEKSVAFDLSRKPDAVITYEGKSVEVSK
jgi:alpha-D-xyloside xylohydrolase